MSERLGDDSRPCFWKLRVAGRNRAATASGGNGRSYQQREAGAGRPGECRGGGEERDGFTMMSS